MTFKRLLGKFLVWRIRHLSTKNFVIIVGGMVGIVGGIAAVTLKSTVHFIQELIRQIDINYSYLFFPVIGIVITALLAKYLLKEQLGH
ncbi:MAG: chloride channel protein, partial [Cytophagia bacterium]|nr:chloride channel protein [Cytophagia bacterium]